ncbi:MAG: hypothetical protein JWR26_2352 [Pedosphaera sp.]|nr:hypothetical protein [Pedosphaera sp.]
MDERSEGWLLHLTEHFRPSGCSPYCHKPSFIDCFIVEVWKQMSGRIVDPAKMVKPYVAIAREQEPDRNPQPATH